MDWSKPNTVGEIFITHPLGLPVHQHYETRDHWNVIGILSTAILNMYFAIKDPSAEKTLHRFNHKNFQL